MRKINVKYLVTAFVALLATWLIVLYTGSARKSSNVRTQLLNLDTAQVDELFIHRQGESTPIVLKRLDKGSWKVGFENQPAYHADPVAVQQALGVLHKLTAQRMLTRQKSKWKQYEVTDSALLVKAIRKGKTIAALRIGKLSYPASGNAFTAVRLNDETETFAVEGYLSTNLGRGLNDWRNKTFMRLNPEKTDKIFFEYPADSSFTLIKADTIWKLDEKPVSPDKVNRYLNQFRNKNLHTFADDFTPSGEPLYRIRFEGKSAELERVDIWQKPDSTYVLRGLHLPVFFSNKGSAIINELLKPKKHFLP